MCDQKFVMLGERFCDQVERTTHLVKNLLILLGSTLRAINHLGECLDELRPANFALECRGVHHFQERQCHEQSTAKSLKLGFRPSDNLLQALGPDDTLLSQRDPLEILLVSFSHVL